MSPFDEDQVREKLEELYLKIQICEGRMDVFAARLDRHGKDIERLEQIKATSEQLKSTMESLTNKIERLSEVIEPIQKGIYWAVGLILASVAAAILTMVIHSGVKP